MSRQHNTRETIRRTVLVASTSDLFLDILGTMIEQGGFRPVFCAEPEPASLSLTRTQPDLVVCDCELLDTATNRLIAETLARGLPLLMTCPRGLSEIELDRLHLPHRAQWLRFPIGHAEFSTAIEELLAPPQPSVARTAALPARTRLEAMVTVRELSSIQP
jgi:DNA-binding response OmpR family regulator